MVKHQINIDVKDIADGAFIENLQTEFEKAFENIHDPNTEYKPKRVVTASFTFSPDEIREVIDLDVDIKTKLAPVKGVTTRIVTSVDLSSESIGAEELKVRQPGQTYFDDEGQMRTDTGRLIDVVEEEERDRQNIIDMKNKMKEGNA